MKATLDSKSALFLGASAMALAFSAPASFAQEADDTASPRTLGTVVVTTQKQEESIQDVPIAVSAFDQSALEKLQLAGGPDLVKSIPNVAASKGNFAGFNFKIRGIGNDAVAQSSDAGVGVHQNDVPLQANRLFEAEFYDVERVETLRGPQGTLYGRNATGGVINVITAKPVLEEFQANARLTYGNFNTFKTQGMLNIPLGETAALRLAGSYLTRDGFADNIITGNDIDSRDLFGIRGTFAWEPTDRLRTFVLLERFEEDSTRLRSGKQLCAKDPFKTEFMGIPIAAEDQLVTSLGCVSAPLDESRDRVNSAATLGGGLGVLAGLLNGDAFLTPNIADLRTIESAFDPEYRAETTLFTARAEFDLTDSLTVTYTGSFNEDSILSKEDYNKIAPDIAFNDLSAIPPGLDPAADIYNALFPGGVVSDPQLGASNIFRTFDLSGGESEQITHELRLQSDFDGRFNFNLGTIYVDFEAIDPQNPTDGYYVFSNTLTALAQLHNALVGAGVPGGALGFDFTVPIDDGVGGVPAFGGSLRGDGGNYFRSLSPFRLESFAVFGESYIDLTDDLQLTIGLRYTDDQKEQDVVDTFLFTPEVAFAGPPQNGDPLTPTGLLAADFQEVTGRIGVDWQPQLSFSQDTLLYAFYSRGYKGGGLNPPQPAGANLFPPTFEPEFINAYEIGTKNTLADGSLQFNATGFLYDYEGYQIQQIINRTAANFNVDAEISGLEIETIWNPASTLIINANLGLLNTEIKDTASIDVLDRTAGDPNFVVLKNAADFSNCVISAAGYAAVLGGIQAGALPAGATQGLCVGAFVGQEGAFGLPDGAFTPGEGTPIDVSGNNIPNAPDTTFNIGVEYTWEALGNGNWDLTGRADYYYQGESFSRIWNTERDRLDSWTNLNLNLRLTNADNGFFVEAFGKNITDEEVITGAYLTDDSSGLFTNIFLTEPATYGITIGKSW